MGSRPTAAPALQPFVLEDDRRFFAPCEAVRSGSAIPTGAGADVTIWRSSRTTRKLTRRHGWKRPDVRVQVAGLTGLLTSKRVDDCHPRLLQIEVIDVWGTWRDPLPSQTEFEVQSRTVRSTVRADFRGEPIPSS